MCRITRVGVLSGTVTKKNKSWFGQESYFDEYALEEAMVAILDLLKGLGQANTDRVFTVAGK